MYSSAGIVHMNSEDHADAGDGTENLQQCGVDAHELQAAYEVFRNKQGNILTPDLPLVSSSLGVTLSDAEIKETTENFEEGLGHEDFISYMGERTHEWPSHLDVKEAFRVFDHEGQGYIKTSQLKKLMQSALAGVDEDAIDCLIQDSCPDGGDDLRYEEFIQFVKDRSKGNSDT